MDRPNIDLGSRVASCHPRLRRLSDGDAGGARQPKAHRGRWQRVSHLATAVDLWGGAGGSEGEYPHRITVIALLRVRAGHLEDVTAPRSKEGPFKDLANAQLAGKQDQVLDEVVAFDLPIQQLLVEAGEVDSILRGHFEVE
jgi:hypothetical protein